MPAVESEREDLPPAIKDLLAWGEENGATLHQNAEVYVSPTYGVSLRVKESTNPTQENGSQDAPRLPPHSRIVSTPYTTSLSYMNAFDAFPTLSAHSPHFPPKFLNEVPAKVIGAFFLIQQYLLGASSFWAPYISSLPQPSEPEKLGTPMYWPEEARTWLEGTNLEGAVRQREEGWRRELEHARGVFWSGCREMGDVGEAREVFGVLCDEAKVEEMGELYRWACTVFSSRSFVSTLIPAEVYGDKLDEKRDGEEETWREVIRREGPYPVLFPLVDIANHDPKARVEWFADVKSEFKTVSIKNDEEIKAGEQIFNNYAPKGNSELLLGYGFMLPDNDDFAIEMRITDPEKFAAITQANENAQTAHDGRIRFHIKTKPHPNHTNTDMPDDLKIFEPGLLDMLSDLVANEREQADWEALEKLRNEGTYDDIVNSTTAGRNFAEVLAMMKGRLEILLEKLVNTTPSGMKPMPGRTATDAQFVKMAQQYRQGQINVLVNAIRILQQRLKELICEDTVEVFRKEEWPEDPCLTLSTAYKFLAEVRPAVYGWIRTTVCGSVNQPNRTSYDKSAIAPPTWIDDVMRFLAEHERAQGEGTDIQREVLWALWMTMILHIDENITQKSEFWPDNLANWVQEMLDVYPIRPMPESDDLCYQVLHGHVAHIAGCDDPEFRPRQKKLLSWNAKKPKLAVDVNAPEDEAEGHKRDDYWRKLAAVALKIVRGETFLGMGTLGRMIEDENGEENGEEHEVLLKTEDAVLFIRRDLEEDE